MKSPTTYLEWMEVFDMAKTGQCDNEVLDAIAKGKLELSGGMATRFATQITGVIQHRLDIAQDKFSRKIQFSAGNIDVLVQSLLALRKDLKFLLKFAELPVLSVNEQKVIMNMIKNQAANYQESLEKTSEKTDRSGVILSTIRRNRIDRLED